MAIPKIANYVMPTNIVDNKTDWTLYTDKAVLLIHDMQNYFVDFYDAAGEPMCSLLKNIAALKKLCNTLDIPVVYTAQPAKQNPKDRALLTDFWGEGVKDEEKIKITPRLVPEPCDTVMTKWRYSAFQRTGLHQFMQQKNRDQLIVCGVYAHIGILTTALEAFMTDIKTFVVQDAVADFSEAEHNMALRYISQRCGSVFNLHQVKQQLLNGVDGSVVNDFSVSTALTLATLKKDVANILNVNASDISNNDNLMDWGLDSIRLMALVNDWKKYNAALEFSDLAENVTLNEWFAILSAREVANEGA
ncbi:MAG: isochorismatase family protein [Marinagarivorans sp.]|nr:isochorismatase family protein [Marinagarivorans sp.]